MLQAIVDHFDEKYKCEEMSDCPYPGTNIINKIPWTGEMEKQNADMSEITKKAGIIDKIKQLFRAIP